MKLVIVESPTKARTLRRYLGKDFEVVSSKGHIRDLPKSKLGVDVEHDFTPQYVVMASKRKVVKELKNKTQDKKEVYLATDPDREGEAIAYHLSVVLGEDKDYKRVTFHEITQEAIMRAMEEPRKIDMHLVDAQQARRVLDRLVGYKLSPLLWKKVRRGLSAGRVQSVAVRLVVDREKEREAFKPEEFWEIKAICQHRSSQAEIELRLVRKGGKKLRIATGQEAETIKQELMKAEYVVQKVQKRRSLSASPAPLTTSALQQLASRQLHFSSKRTMKLAQDLYERGLITYHRTDSLNLAETALRDIRSFIKMKWGEKYLPDKPKRYKTKAKSAQEAHEAIRPTDIRVEKVNEDLNNAHQRLYDLIRRRTIQSQMKNAEIEKTKVIVGAGDCELEADGERVIFEGWQILTNKKEVKNLPLIKEREILLLIKLKSEQKFSQPPARYSEAGLIKELEKRGIGRPSTYATIIDTIQQRMYVVKEENRFVPTPVGKVVTEFLVKYFEQIMDYEFTAQMEEDLDEIARGDKKWVEVVRVFWNPFIKRLTEVDKEAKRVVIPAESTGRKCPKCGEGELVVRVGRFGKFISCQRFPECDYKEQYVEYAKGVVCPQCGGKVVVRKTRKGRRFYGCENYPKCKWMGWKLKEAKVVKKTNE